MVRIAFRQESGLWKACPAARTVIRRAVDAAMAGGGLRAHPQAELSVLLTNDAQMQRLNRVWRGKNAPTNVLSFPSVPAGQIISPPFLGDVALAYETIAREVDILRVPFENHLSHLAIHGILHLFGYDHQTEAEAERMEALEVKILEMLDIANPYADNSSSIAGLDPNT